VKRPFLISAFFALLILFGIGCRFYNLNWDEGAQLHPDERFVARMVNEIGLARPYFNSAFSPLNPINLKANYVYGQFPLLIAKLAAQLFSKNDVVSIIYLGRYLSAIFDSFTVLLTFLIGRRLFETKWAFFAAMCVAIAALHVQQSHFFVTDTFAATFITASCWAGIRFAQNHKRLDAVWMGLFWGLAMACKISAIFWGIGVLGLFAVAVHRSHLKTNKWPPIFPTLVSLLLCVGIAFVAFRLSNPMAFRGEDNWGIFDIRLEPRFFAYLSQQSAITRGEVDIPFNVQWIGTTKWLFSFTNLGNWGYGWAILLSGLGGILLLLKKRRGELLIAASFALFLFCFQGAQFSKFTRYFLPLTPFIGLLAAHFWRELTDKKSIFQYGALVTALWAGGWCWAVTSVYSQRHTRIEASKWLVENLKPGTVVTNETGWDEGLPLSWLPTGNGNLKYQLLETYEPDTPEKRARMIEMLDKTEWLFFSSGRSWQNIPRWPEKWPMTYEFYSALWDGSLGFEKVREFTSYPRLGPFEFPDDNSEEALSVYDHPRVILWRKTKSYSHNQTSGILNGIALPPERQWRPNFDYKKLQPAQ
jgi:4-amino-4-deoxy-L-arabinose transferase-like glycosyltransferase